MVMKVKLFNENLSSEFTLGHLEEKINDFIKDKEIVSINQQTIILDDRGHLLQSFIICYNA